MPEKRQSDPNPAIRFSFYNKLFDVNNSSQRLSPERDFRKFSLPTSMSSLHDQQSVSSLASPPWGTFKAYGKKITRSRSQGAHIKFLWTVKDEAGDGINGPLLSPLSPMENFIDEQCLHFEENFVNIDEFEAKFFDSFDRKFEDESFFQRQISSESVFGNDTVCKKCGHDILRL